MKKPEGKPFPDCNYIPPLSGGEGGIVGIYLAAGRSSRMGTNKLFLPLGGVPLGSIALKTALDSNLDRVIVIVSGDRENDSFADDEGNPKPKPDDSGESAAHRVPGWIPSELLQDPYRGKWRHIVCADAKQAQAHSLRSGVLEALSQQAEAAVVLLADQPFVSVQMINRLITEYTQGAAANRKHLFVASGYQGLPHSPVLFARELFPDLLRLKGDEGARRLLPKESLFQGKTIGYTDARLFLDIDTEEDYRLLKFLH